MNLPLTHSTASFDLAPEIITALKQYEIRSRLSMDHTGQVLEAWDKQLHRPVVIRQIQHLGVAGEQVIQQARLAASLKHAAFAKIHALEEAGDSLLIVTEAVNGTSLAQWIASHASVEKRSLDHIAQVAAALSEAHQAGLVHGDIQASQFIVDQSGKIRILNCGFVSSSASYMLGSLEQIDARGGIAYLAPERFANAPASPAADVYALGCLLYEMLNGSLPFAHLQGLAMVASLVQSDPEQWPWNAKLTPPVRKLMLDMCKRVPEQRLTCAQIVEACRALRANDPYSGSVGSLSLAALQAQLAKAERRQKFYKLSAALLAVVLLAGLSLQFKPYWPQVVKALTPYSESREMERGMNLLEQYAQLTLPKYLNGASEHFATVLEHDPENAEAVAAMAYIYFQRYQSNQRDEVWMQKAKASTQQALLLNPNLAMTQVVNARLLQWHHELKNALAAAERSIELAPKGILGWHVKMSILLELGQQDAAIQFAEEGAKIFPKDRVMLDLSAGIFLAGGRFAESELVLKKSLERQPEGGLAYALMAQGLVEQRKDIEALQYVQRGLEVFPSPNLYSTLGDIHQYQGKYEEAADAYEKAVSPAFGVAGSYLRWLNYAESLMWTKSRKVDAKLAFDRARSLLDIRLRRSPDDPYLVLNLVHILIRLDDRNGALELMSRLKMKELINDSSLVKLAQVYEMLGQRELAVQQLLTIRRMGMPIDVRLPIFDGIRVDPKYRALFEADSLGSN
ncbi:MAG: protein kinase [Burkholderiales bacterium]|nr:protein kinase [Burkholderiales bacterium]